MSQLTSKQAFYRGVRASIQWLHEEALRMNDPHARSVLNNAAFHLGVAKPDPALVVEDGTTQRERNPGKHPEKPEAHTNPEPAAEGEP